MELSSFFKTKKWLLPALIVVIALSSGIAGFLLGRQTIQTQPTPTSIIPTPTFEPTANWKTYINESCEFQMKYPGDFELNPGGSEGSDTINRYISESNNIFIKIDSVYPNSSKEIKEILSLKMGERVKVNDLPEDKRYIERTQDKKIGGQFVPQYKGNLCLIDSPCPIGTVTWYVYFKKKDDYCRIFMDDRSLEENRKLFDQILSTFKFLDQEPTTKPTSQPLTIPNDWQEFTDTDTQAKLTVTLSVPPGYGLGFSGSEWNLGKLNEENWDYSSSILFDENGNPKNEYDGSSRRAWYQRYLNDEFFHNVPPIKTGEIVSVSEYNIGSSTYLEAKVNNPFSQQIENHYLYVQNGILHIIKPQSGNAFLLSSLIAKNIGIIFTSLKSSFAK